MENNKAPKRLIALCLVLFIFYSEHNLIAQDAGVDYATQSLQIALEGEPPNIDSTQRIDQIGSFIMEHIQEGLLRKDRRNRLVAGMAERWEMEGSKATFWLRPNVLWSDGKPVTAHDFVFAWRTVVNPESASEYAAFMYYVKNGSAINKGEMPLEALGVKALDDRTLEVELESPTGYFLSMLSFPTFYPLREDFYRAQNGRYAADADNILSNGPYVLSEWVHGASLRMDKNPNYWNKDEVGINSIKIPYVTPDSAARFNLFKDGKLAIENAMLGLESDQLQDAVDNRFRIRSRSDGSQFWMEFNHHPDRATANLNLRKAMQAVFDSQELVDKVVGIPGYIPGKSIFPVWLDGVENKFRQEYPAQEIELNLTKARAYLEQAKQELGVSAIPPLVMVIDDRPIGSLLAEYFQNLFKTRLGLDIKIDKQTFKIRLEKMTDHDFDLVLAGWGPDYEDPMTFAEYFASWSENNRLLFSNPEFDAALRDAQNSLNPSTRMQAFAKAQKIIIDEAAVLPTYERVISYVQNPKLRGVLFKVTGGSPIFTYARISE